MFLKQCTYGDFLKSDEKIATNILASRLQTLEENGIITKSEHPDSKAKVLYKLTQKGIDLLPVMIEINLWAEKYFTIPAEQKAMLKEVKKDKEAFIKTAKKNLKKAVWKKAVANSTYCGPLSGNGRRSRADIRPLREIHLRLKKT